MTAERQTISAKNGSVVIVALTVAEKCDINCDNSSLVLVWDDEDDSISSIRDEIKQALENQLVKVRPPIYGPTPQDKVT